MEHLAHCDALEREIGQFVSVAKDADLLSEVPACPGWDVAKLIRHQGTVHRWADWHVQNLAQERAAKSDIVIETPEVVDFVAWLADGGAALVATLRATDPEAPMWAWGADQHVAFWSRRQAHETAIHRADLELALGRTPSIEPSLAIDGIDELLANIPYAAYFAPNTAKLVGNGESIHLHCTDSHGEWTITLGQAGFSWEHAHTKCDVAVRARADQLLLLLVNRLAPSDPRFEIFGDSSLLEFWLKNSAL